MTPFSRPDLPELRDARRQHGVITRRQLRDLGLSAEAIRHRVRCGRLHVVHRGVYAVGRPDLRREGWWIAAVLACGEGAALSHVPAGLLWGLLERGDERPHVSVPTRAGRRGPRGVTIHRPGAPLEAERRLGISVTTIIRTLIDLAGVLDARALRGAIRNAERLHRLDLRRLAAAVQEPASDHRKARLRSLLQVYVPGAVNPGLEDEFLQLCRRYRVPLPTDQVRVGRSRVDFLWHDIRLVVEVDDRSSHDTYTAFVDDRVRDRRLKADGFEVLRFTWTEVRHRPAATADELRTAIARWRAVVDKLGS